MNNWICRDEDSEKLSKSDDGSAVAVSAQAPPTMPHVPITTPPPPVMGADMTAQTGYGGYSSWYQVRFEILQIEDESLDKKNFRSVIEKMVQMKVNRLYRRIRVGTL